MMIEPKFVKLANSLLNKLDVLFEMRIYDTIAWVCSHHESTDVISDDMRTENTSLLPARKFPFYVCLVFCLEKEYFL